MGVSIDIHSYNYAALCTKISDIAAMANTKDRTAEYFVDFILPEFGVVAGDRYLTLWNEYYDEYNSGSELMRAVDLYFGVEDTYLSGYDYIGGANAYEVLEALHIQPIRTGEYEEEDY